MALSEADRLCLFVTVLIQQPDRQVMARLLRVSTLAVVLVVLLAACGQKGPLYLPTEEPPKEPTQEESR